MNSYTRRLVITDILIVFCILFTIQFLRFGSDTSFFSYTLYNQERSMSYLAASLSLGIVWIAALWVSGSYGDEIYGAGVEEYNKVLRATFSTFGLLGISMFIANASFSRTFLIFGLPIGISCLLLGRWFWRKWIISERKNGRFTVQLILIGESNSLSVMVGHLNAFPGYGYVPVGVLDVSQTREEINFNSRPLRYFTSMGEVEDAIAEGIADSILVTDSSSLEDGEIKKLGWMLEPNRQHLLLAPGIVDVGGPRIHTRPIANLSFVEIQVPKFSQLSLALKRILDLVLSISLLTLLSPLFVMISLLIWKDRDGPIFFFQERIGIEGRPFRMYKFRTMRQSAESDRSMLTRDINPGENQILFKMKDDPRVTKIGKNLRRWSLDELPQLVNVFLGNMSLVGPRPPLSSEVAMYEDHFHRRFLVKPGITGLWQVSGRSDLSWDESIRLDLYYVENWSITMDTMILFRTFRAVFGQKGAY